MAFKITYSRDVGGIVSDGRIMTDIGIGSMGHSVEVPTIIDFRPVCVSAIQETHVVCGIDAYVLCLCSIRVLAGQKCFFVSQAFPGCEWP